MIASVIIPTHNRREHVLRAVKALVLQELSPDSFEIIVACDRCTDGTQDAVRSLDAKNVKLLEPSQPGQTPALNAAVSEAQGEFALILDDEIEAAPHLISSHVDAHRAAGSKAAVVGRCQPIGDSLSPLQRLLADSCESYYRELGRPGHRATVRDMCGSNVSFRTAELRAAGGFSQQFFFERSDFELAARLLQRGFRLLYSPEALGFLNLAVNADSMIRRTRERARNDCQLAREFPWCVPHLEFYRLGHDPAVRRRWQLIWPFTGILAETCHAARHVFGRENLKLVNLEYALRYSHSLRTELGAFRKLQALCEQNG